MNTETKQTAKYDGQCAFAVSLGKKDVAGSASQSLVQNGETYWFSNPVAKLIWRVFPGRKQKADSTWSG